MKEHSNFVNAITVLPDETLTLSQEMNLAVTNTGGNTVLMLAAQTSI